MPTLPEVVAPPTPPPQPKAAMKIEPEKKAAPKKVIAPSVVPNRGPGRNSLIDERMKARRQTVFEAPKWDDIEEEPPKKTEPKPVEQKPAEQKSTNISVSQNKPNITKITQNKPQQITKIQQTNSSRSSPALQRKNILQEEVKPEVDLSQSFNETLKSSDTKKPAIAKFKLPELSQDIVDAAKEAAKPVTIFNPEMDLKAVMEEDDKWFKKQQEAKNKKKEEPVKVVKLANGKVKKGSGMRYDKKLGFERYWPSSEEETESGESEGEPEEGALPTQLMGFASVKIDFNYYDSTSEESDSDDDSDEKYDNRPMSQREANKVDKLYDGNCEYIRAKREFEREMREIKERQQKKKAAESAPVYNNVETLKREQRMFAGLSKF